MRWTTREHIHFDRAISAWLIKRFVDPDADFIFGSAGDEGSDEAGREPAPTSFGVPGVELSGHDAGGSTFHKILVKYRLTDPALLMLDDIVTQGLAYLFAREEPADEGLAGEVVVGLLALVEGVVLSAADDADALAKSLVLYDALYALAQARTLSQDHDEAGGMAKMGTGLWRTAFAVTLASDRRAAGTRLGPHRIAEVSEGFAPALQRLRDR